MQLTINIAISTSLFGLAAAGISLAHATTRQMPFTLAATMSLAAYCCHGLYIAGWPIWVSVFVAMFIGAVVACLLDLICLRHLDKVGKVVWATIAMSLGVYLVIQAALLICFGEAGRSYQMLQQSYAVCDGRITGLQVSVIAISLVVISSLLGLLAFTRYGRAIRGLASNQDLCVVFGIRTGRVRTLAVGLAGVLTSLATVLFTCDSGLVPSTGFTLFLTGAIVAILGGAGSGWGVAGGAVLLATALHCVAYYCDPKWMDALPFVILIVFLIWKPLGFSGRRLKKVEI